MINKNLKASAGISGRVRTSVYDMDSKKAEKLEKEIEYHLAGSPSKPKIYTGMSNDVITALIGAWREKKEKHYKIYKEMVAEMSRLFKVREYYLENLICLVGRSVIAQRLSNDTTYTGVINYGLLGTGSTAVNASDTTLETEVFRKITAPTSFTDNQAFIDFFYSKSDTNGTYNEFGTVIDGTASADTGQLFTHALTGGWVKSSNESMTIAVIYDINYQA